MNAFFNALTRGPLTTLQINLGDLCNQSCRHCHVAASPQGRRSMGRRVVDDILGFLEKHKIRILDITGGAPELNPHFEYLALAARPLVHELIIRSNLTMLLEPAKLHLPKLFKTLGVHVIASLPCYLQENVDQQRGSGVFQKCMAVLRQLNNLGFAVEPDLKLDLVCNPLGPELPGSQQALEQAYKQNLREKQGVEFNRLLTITNIAIGKFREQLEADREYEKYAHLLRDHFNPQTVDHLMCRTYLSVGYDGRLYDCDFNLALGLALQDPHHGLLDLNRLNPDALPGRAITLGEHCLACMAGNGSGCQGALAVVA